MGKPGILVVSLDFELFWGIRDFARLAEHRERLIRVRGVVPRVLELFRQYGVHATWATVGMLFCSSDAELRRYLPDRLPAYADPSQSPYGDLAQIGRNEFEDPFHLAPSLIEAIRSAPNQEIGSHTFSGLSGKSCGCLITNTWPLSCTRYAMDGKLVRNVRLYSRSRRLEMISKWSWPKKPTFNPRPSASFESGSKLNAASFKRNFSKPRFRSSNFVSPSG